MRTYAGIKFVEARPMAALDAQKEGYRCTSEQLAQNAPGYEVEYEGGYKSWSPRDVFDQAYDYIRPIDQVGNEANAAALRHFDFMHLAGKYHGICQPFCALAHRIVNRGSDPREVTIALRELLKARDAALRAFGLGL